MDSVVFQNSPLPKFGSDSIFHFGEYSIHCEKLKGAVPPPSLSNLVGLEGTPFRRKPFMLQIRPALAPDVPLLRTMIHEFAEFEHDRTAATEESLLRDGFGAKPMFRVLLAERDGEPAGYSLFFDCYASFQGPGIYLEDIYVRPQFRGTGIGRALCAQVATIARRESRFGIMFTVMDWNRPAIEFYQRLGATFLNDWKVVCLRGNTLEGLAKEARS